MSEKLIIKIYRSSPNTKPYVHDYFLNRDDIEGQMLLNVLEHIKSIDHTLGFRRSCGEGVCGSDGMNINGKNGLACITPLKNLPNKITLYPLPGFAILKDLIVDMTQFYEQYKRAQPYLQPKEPLPEKEILQTPAQREKLDGLYECIMCGCCSSACPSYWWNPDKFMGPAALLNAQRFLVDSRDDAKDERLEKMQDAYSVYRCRGIMNCAAVCPKGLNPTQAITEIKKKVLFHKD